MASFLICRKGQSLSFPKIRALARQGLSYNSKNAVPIPKSIEIEAAFILSNSDYFRFAFASSANLAKPSASLIAISDNTLRFITTPAFFKPNMNLL